MASEDKIKEDGRAFEIKNFRFDVAYQHPDYALKYDGETSMSPKGEWTVFRFEHPDGHWYRGRWDEKDSALDIDLFATKHATKATKNFPGHHTNQAVSNFRTFVVDVERDNAPMLQGRVSFTLTRRASLEGKAAIIAARTPKLWQRIWYWLPSMWRDYKFRKLMSKV